MTIGTWTYQAGTDGIITLPVNAVITHIRAGSRSNDGSIQIFGGDVIPIRGQGNANPTIFEMVFPDNKRAMHREA